MEKKCKKAKWLSGEALQIAVKRREAKSQAEKERYKHLNAEFQRIARRDKKAFFSDQCKEIEENNRMRKTRDLFKIRDTKFLIKKKAIYIYQMYDFTIILIDEVSHIYKFIQTMPKPLTVWITINCGKF